MKRTLLCMASVALAACVSYPTGPSVMTLPGTGKSYEQFRFDDYECRQYAQSSVGMSADQAAADAGAKSVALARGAGQPDPDAGPVPGRTAARAARRARAATPGHASAAQPA